MPEISHPTSFVNDDKHNYYPFSRMQVLILHNNIDDDEIVLDIIVSSNLITNDFNVNCLTFSDGLYVYVADIELRI